MSITPIQVSNRQVFNRQSRADWPLFLKRAKIVQKVFPSIFDFLETGNLETANKKA